MQEQTQVGHRATSEMCRETSASRSCERQQRTSTAPMPVEEPPRSSMMRRLMSTAKTTMHPAAYPWRDYKLDALAAIRQQHQTRKSGPQRATSAFPPIATKLRTSRHVGFVPISLQKSVGCDRRPFGAAGFDPPVLTLYATPTLRNAQNLSRWRSGHQCCEPP